MSADTTKKKLFRVAQEFNVPTTTLVDLLVKSDFKVENKPNFTVTPDMYAVIDKAFGPDKVRSKEHERTRDEYETRRNEIQRSRNDKVTIDPFSDPTDLLTPIDDLLTIEPIEAPAPPKKQPVETKEEPKQEIEPRIEPEVVVPPPVSKPASTPEPVRTEPKATPAAPEKPVEPSVKSREKEEPKPVFEQKRERPAQTPASRTQEIIRARAERLKGTSILGKMSIPSELPPVAPEDPALKRKKKKKKIVSGSKRTDSADAPAGKQVVADSEEESKKNKKKRTSKKENRISDVDVESKMKETMALLQGGGTGKKRQKRRKLRRDEIAAERELMDEMSREAGSVIELSEFITVSDYADLLDVSVNSVITACMGLGMFVSINQRLDAANIELIAAEFDREIRFVGAEQLVAEHFEEEDLPESLEPRAPVVTVMGHVDHGKTSLLDYIRKTKVTAGEAGGITQHIGAYSVNLPDGRTITFLDTPGHEAFTAMRARGAQATDIVILVVAADDRVMPQTIEAINHAQAGGVPIVVAINKVDKHEANTDKIRQQLSDHNVIVEEWGGKTQCAEVSAHTGVGIDSLLEKVLIEAELMELKANPNRRASGVILETKVDKGKGVVANVLVQKGTLRVGEPFVAGPYYGRVRLMENEHGKKLDSAGPSTPIQLIGFDGLPQAGDRIMVTADEKTAKEIALQRQQIKREQDLRKVKHLTLDDIARRMALGDIAELNLIVKGDVDGSIEALSGSLQKISNDEVKVHIIHTGVGAISESDVLLASASDAIIIGFQVRPTTNARKLAEKEEIDIRLFSVIYDAVDAIKDALEGMLSPELGEKITATVEVRETFKVPNVGTIAGCYVTEGKITRNTKIRLIRDGIVIYNGVMSSLKRFKDDVREVSAGYECGIGIQSYNDLRVGDIIEGYEITETKRKLTQ